MLSGHNLEHGDGIPLQQFFPGVGCGVLSCLLSSSPCAVGLCRERTQMVCRALLVPSAHHKSSTRAHYNRTFKAEQCEGLKEKKASRSTSHLCGILEV